MIERDEYIVRIVRLTISKENVDAFNKLYKQYEDAISSQPGCLSVDLFTDASNPYVRATISKWRDVESLNRYRHSELFGVVWPATKALFAAKPEVWTYEARSF
ncbi:MAG: antibiotic biosynthesis monooxygenase [Crocinitomicaceae bacterium]|nr:antibiotic biosynthesis monooxygenase [Crocinitomicaceae bacterium]|tara:strand:+ start:2766 stop:3074 length:309 start_codon:yes stop_codon:yes gene_type:complete